jgi:uncharacterized membrane protein YbhN (UPF0104 family)
MMPRLREHPLAMTLTALAIAAVAVVAIAAAYGFGSFADAWTHLHPGWLALTVGGELVAIPAYALAYRTLVRMQDGPKLKMPLVFRIVVAGFGAFAPGGGFVLDRHVLHAVSGDEDHATIRVLGLGALEWALLAPAACIVAIVALATGDHRPMASLLWPWAIAVPIGFALGLWLATREPEQLDVREDGWRGTRDKALAAVGMLPRLARGFPSCWVAWLGAALYWVCDIAAFYGAVRFIGLRLNLGEAILAYATGYALTRRSMPLGGAGVTETLMTFALHWVGQPVAPALAAVVVYRLFNFVLPTLPALVTRPRIGPLLAAAEEGRVPAARERRHAAAPLRRLGIESRAWPRRSG